MEISPDELHHCCSHHDANARPLRPSARLGPQPLNFALFSPKAPVQASSSAPARLQFRLRCSARLTQHAICTLICGI